MRRLLRVELRVAQPRGGQRGKRPAASSPPARRTIYLHLSSVANAEPSGQTVEQLEAQMTFISIEHPGALATREDTNTLWLAGSKSFPISSPPLATHSHTQGMIMFSEREQNDLRLDGNCLFLEKKNRSAFYVLVFILGIRFSIKFEKHDGILF